MSASTSVKFRDGYRNRLKALAEAKQRSPNWLVNEAVARYLESEESEAEFRAEAERSLQHMRETGLHVTHEEAMEWLLRRSRGERVPAQGASLMVRVEWSELAFADLDRFDAFLRPKNPRAADDAFFAIYQAVVQLEDFPEIGRPALDMPKGYRELPVPFSNSGYLILYYYDQWVSVVRVRHQFEAGY